MGNKNICKNCKYWEKNVKHSYLKKYSGGCKEIYTEYSEYDSIPCWAKKIEIVDLGDIDQLIGQCTCSKMIYADPEFLNPHDAKNVVTDALYYMDAQGCSAWVGTGENFGCIHFRKNETSRHKERLIKKLFFL